jgi:uncharacterized protein HemX
MKKFFREKLLLILGILVLGFACSAPVLAQKENKKEKTEKKKEKNKKEKKNKKDKKDKQEETVKQERRQLLERPALTGMPNVDAFDTTAFNTYYQSIAITDSMTFIKIETKEIPDAGDGVTTEVKITDGSGRTITPAVALERLGKLLIMAVEQSNNISKLQALQKAATEEVESASTQQKLKASKPLAVSGKALAFVLEETKKQIESINKQIKDVKSSKEY